MKSKCPVSNAMMLLAMSFFISVPTVLVEAYEIVLNVTDKDPPIDFILPKGDGDDRELIVFFDGIEEGNDTYNQLILFFHEYYLTHTDVTLCKEVLYNILKFHDGTQEDIDDQCDTFQPGCKVGVEIKRDRYLNITLPSRYDKFVSPPELLKDRMLFNITCFYGPPEQIEEVRNKKENPLAYCNLNGVPTIYETEDRNYKLGCECRGGATGEQCQWGGICHNGTEREVCSNHGRCRYQAGKTMCVCDNNRIGRRCQYEKNILSTNCGKRLQCQHNCHMFNGSPFCSCEAGFRQNGTRCYPADLQYNVTVKFDNEIDEEEVKNKTLELLKRNKIPDREIYTPNRNSTTVVHFLMSEKYNLPAKEEWDETFNMSVSLEKLSLFRVGLRGSEEPGAAILHCTLRSSLPIFFKWYKDDHLILVVNVTSNVFEPIEYEKVKVLKDEYEQEQRLTLIIKNYDPMVDWGNYTCEATSDHVTFANSTLVTSLTQPFQVEVIPKVTVVEENANLSVRCMTRNDWYGSDQYSMAWKVSPEDAVSEIWPETLHWNGSIINLYNISKSVNLTCYVRNDSCTNMATVEGKVLVLTSSDYSFCPSISEDGLEWPAMTAGERSFTECPSGFHGKCSRDCLLEDSGGNNTAWGTPDYSQCLYSPLLEIASNPEVILQGRGYPLAIKDANAVANTFLHILKKRSIASLPSELSAIATLLGKFTNSFQNPVTLFKFVEILQFIITNYSPSIKSTLVLRDVATKFLKHILKLSQGQESIKDFHDVSAHLKRNLRRESPFIVKNIGGMSIEIFRDKGHRESREFVLDVGVLTYRSPSLLLANITENRRHLHGGELPIELMDSPIVEVMIVSPVPNSVSSLEQVSLQFNYNFYQETEKNIQRRYPALYSWSRVCGRIHFEDHRFSWDLSACSHVDEGEQNYSVKCQCKGQGIFGVFLQASLAPKGSTEQESNEIVVVLVVCCVTLTILLLLSLAHIKCSGQKLPSRSHIKRTVFRRSNESSSSQDTSHQDSGSAERLVCHRNGRFSTSMPRTVGDRVNACHPCNYIPPDAVHHRNSNDSIEYKTIAHVDETDSAYVNMDSDISQETDLIKGRVHKVHTYVNEAGSCSAVGKCEGVSTSFAVANKQRRWVTTNRENPHSYLPMIVKNDKQ